MVGLSEKGSRFRYVLIAALISGAIVEGLLLLMSHLGVGDAANRVLAEAEAGLHKLTPWSMAVDYAKWLWEWIQPTPSGQLLVLSYQIPILAFIMFLSYPFYLIYIEPWPAALIDVVQFSAGVATAVYACKITPLGEFLGSRGDGFGAFVLVTTILILLVFFCITMLSLVVLGIIVALSGTIAFVIPSEHAVAITYSSIIGGGVSFVSNRSAETALHEWILRVVRRK